MGSWTRLEQVIKWTGLTTNAFALSIGLKRSENLYQIKKGRNSISKDLAELIAVKYSGISQSWLLTGEGSMFTEENDQDPHNPGIPYYGSNLAFVKDQRMKFPAPLYYMDIPVLSNCDFAVTWPDDSMSPEILSGSIITLKETEIPSVLPGEIYLVVTENYMTMRRLRSVGGNEQSLRLVPANKDIYEETLIDKTSIRRLFIVKGVISVKVF
jgi:hypothetical protein